jgi:hypothetical protein
VDAHVDPEALARVVEVLERRTHPTSAVLYEAW